MLVSTYVYAGETELAVGDRVMSHSYGSLVGKVTNVTDASVTIRFEYRGGHHEYVRSVRSANDLIKMEGSTHEW